MARRIGESLWLATGDFAEGGDPCSWYVSYILRPYPGRTTLSFLFHCTNFYSPGKYRELQRVTVPYAKLLDMVDNTDTDAMDL